jgi:hypothetical protein
MLAYAPGAPSGDRSCFAGQAASPASLKPKSFDQLRATRSKYPPAEPALVMGPLEAAVGVADAAPVVRAA